MPAKCPKCGAEYPAGETCRDRFNLCLAAEFEHPDTYGMVHMLNVAGYMLQHNEYSREGWLWTRESVSGVLRGDVTPEDARRRDRGALDSGRRAWSVTRGPKIPEVDALPWARTLADVRLETAEIYCADVRQWVMSVLADTEALAQELKQES
jgi:hypothetical protein